MVISIKVSSKHVAIIIIAIADNLDVSIKRTVSSLLLLLFALLKSGVITQGIKVPIIDKVAIA